MAPEINKGIMYDNKVDIYSFGLIIYELCTLEFGAFKRHIISLERYGNKMQVLINSTLQEEFDKRPSAEEISEIFHDEAYEKIKENILDFIIKNDPEIENMLIEKGINNSLVQIDYQILANQIEKRNIIVIYLLQHHHLPQE